MNISHLNKLFTGVCYSFLGLLSIGIVRGSIDTLRYFELKKSLAELQQATYDLKNDNKNIELEVLNIKTSPQYAKKILKDRFHMTEDNEELVFMAD
jgi:cell division protein FtsB